MCPANYLVRMLLRHILVRRKEIVVADMEAGTEHLARGTAKHVDAMLVIVEPSAKALETARRIRKLAMQMKIRRILLVGNKLLNKKDESIIRTFAEKNNITTLGMIHYDPAVREADLAGKSLFLSFPSSQAVREMEVILDLLIEII